MTKFTKGKKCDEFRSAQPPPPPAPTIAEEQEQTGQDIAGFYATLLNTSRKFWTSRQEENDQGAIASGSGLGYRPTGTTAADSSSIEQQQVNKEESITILKPGQENLVSSSKQTSTGVIALPKSNIGYKLLEKAGWSGSGGIGAREQGIVEPIQPEIRLGNVGLGFETKSKKKNLLTKDSLATEKDKKTGGVGVGGMKSSKDRKFSALPPDELADEDINTKVKRVKQVMQTEADDKAGKELARLVYSSFRDDGGGGGSTDVNPLLRKNKKISARNPLL